MYVEGNEDDHSHQPYAEADKRVRSEAGQIQAVRMLGGTHPYEHAVGVPWVII